MTHDDLVEYTLLRKRISNVRRELEELDSKRTAKTVSLPPSVGGCSEYYMEDILDRTEDLKSELEDLHARKRKALSRLTAAEGALTNELELSAFVELYRRGNPPTVVAQHLKYSITHIYQLRKRILRRVASL